MNKLLFGLVSIGISAMSFADVGIGVSVQEDDNRIYLPINVSSSFRVVPAVRYFQSDSRSGDFETEFEEYDLGIGFFGLHEVNEKLNLLYGARLSYIKSHRDFRSGFIALSGGSEIVAVYSETELEGYAVAPTMGIEYFLADNFSLGGEISLYFQDLDGHRLITLDDERTNISEKSVSTDTFFNVSFYF